MPSFVRRVPRVFPVTCVTGPPLSSFYGGLYRQQPSPIDGKTPKEHKMAFLSLTKAAAKTSVLTIALIAALPSTSFAGATNMNIKVGKADLKSKCNSSGGKFESSSDGYSCTVDRSDGSSSVVSCGSSQSCFGANIDAPLVRGADIRQNSITTVQRTFSITK